MAPTEVSMACRFFEPRTVDEALALGAQWGERGSYLAGGTDLVIQMRRGRKDPQALISLARLADLRGLQIDGGWIRLGALATQREIERHPAFAGGLRALVEGARVIGGPQVRNVATVAGNVCNASPAADLVPVLLVLEADVHLRGPGGERRAALREFLLGPGRTGRQPGELVTAVSFARPDGPVGTAFLKFGRRRAMEISVVCVAAAVRRGPHGGPARVRLAVGAAAPTAIRLGPAERLLEDALERDPSLAVWPEPLLAAVGQASAEVVSPLSDVRASARYRRDLVRTLVPRAAAIALERVTTT